MSYTLPFGPRVYAPFWLVYRKTAQGDALLTPSLVCEAQLRTHLPRPKPGMCKMEKPNVQNRLLSNKTIYLFKYLNY